jgi:hypothetical protein
MQSDSRKICLNDSQWLSSILVKKKSAGKWRASGRRNLNRALHTAEERLPGLLSGQAD